MRSHTEPITRNLGECFAVADCCDRSEKIRALRAGAGDRSRSTSFYTSGTTGKPKGVVRDNGGHLVALKCAMFNLYGVKPGEVWWCGSDIGWVVGHSYIIYAPLFHGATSIMYEGKPIATPGCGRRLLARDLAACAVGSSPRQPRSGAIRKEDPDGKFIRQTESVEIPTSVPGRRNAPIHRTGDLGGEAIKVPVIDHWWQTETGWCIAGNPVGLGMLPVKHGSPTVPMPAIRSRWSMKPQDRCGRTWARS